MSARCFPGLILVAMTFLSVAATTRAQPPVLPRESPAATISQRLGVGTVTVAYHRPALKGRRMFGSLVEFGKVWRAGANEATTISFTHDVTVEGHPVPTGTYALFMIPGPGKWTVILSGRPRQWGAFNYDPSADILRFEVATTTIPLEERLQYLFPAVDSHETQLAMRWETTQVAFRIAADTRAQTLTAVRAEFTWGEAFAFAEHFLTLRENDEAQKWARIAVLLDENSASLVLLGDTLAALGRFPEAVTLGEKALERSAASGSPAGERARVEKRLSHWRSGREGLPRPPRP